MRPGERRVAAGLPLRIGVIGSGSAGEADLALARAVGAAVARAEAITVCGGLGGVMGAVAEGAAAESGLVVGILPGASAGDAAPGVSIPIPTGLGEARNVVVARASEAVIAIAGEWGTLSEAAFCRKFGVPVIGLHATLPDDVVSERADEPAAAVARAVELALARRREGP
ncbi:MAG: TIGR00725 family protein [Gemmatimonadota bacterium]|nr:TIGR00725 family protein [Gemmatimonadota bacterium]